MLVRKKSSRCKVLVESWNKIELNLQREARHHAQINPHLPRKTVLLPLCENLTPIMAILVKLDSLYQVILDDILGVRSIRWARTYDCNIAGLRTISKVVPPLVERLLRLVLRKWSINKIVPATVAFMIVCLACLTNMFPPETTTELCCFAAFVAIVK